jgi:hypothetical protein
MASSRSAHRSWHMSRGITSPEPLRGLYGALMLIASVNIGVIFWRGELRTITGWVFLFIFFVTFFIAFSFFRLSANHGAESQLDRLRARFYAVPIRGLTALAALLAGRKRPARNEWRAHLAGESGHDPLTRPKVRQAVGFVASAVQCRLVDAADMAWRPADAVLGSRSLSNLFVWGPVVAMLVAIVHHDGRFGLVADDQDPVALGAFLYVVIKTGRWWRGVKLPEPKARRAKE